MFTDKNYESRYLTHHLLIWHVPEGEKEGGGERRGGEEGDRTSFPGCGIVGKHVGSSNCTIESNGCLGSFDNY